MDIFVCLFVCLWIYLEQYIFQLEEDIFQNLQHHTIGIQPLYKQQNQALHIL